VRKERDGREGKGREEKGREGKEGRNTSSGPLQNTGSTTASKPDQICKTTNKKFNYVQIMFNFTLLVTLGWKTAKSLMLHKSGSWQKKRLILRMYVSVSSWALRVSSRTNW
jgi:hypothetical protein